MNGRYEYQATTCTGEMWGVGSVQDGDARNIWHKHPDATFGEQVNELVAQGWEPIHFQWSEELEGIEGPGWHVVLRRWYPTGVAAHEEEPHKARERERREQLGHRAPEKAPERRFSAVRGVPTYKGAE